MRAFKLALAFTALTSVASHAQETREQIRVVGSSTVYPFITSAAENFGKQGKFKTPIVESTGTGGGFKLFCSGATLDTPDMNNASRKITAGEIEQCKANGVNNIIELTIGYDGIVVANTLKGPEINLTRKELFTALAREIPKDGKLVKNPYTKWNEINPKLPAQSIEVYGPPPTSGTRDAFVELVMEEGCKETPEFKAAIPDDKARKDACKLIREDGRYVEAGEDDNLIIQKLTANPNALGIFGYSFLAENKAKVKGNAIDGIKPDYKNIESGKYSISRSLFVYVKGEHIGKVAGIPEFVKEFTSNGAIGEEGYLVQRGLLPLHADELKKSQQVASTKLSVKAPETAPAR